MAARTIFLTVSLLGTLAASFSLNISGPDWDYTVKDLAKTTSDACKEAYSADIACDETLLGLVASMRPAFHPGSSDLDLVCTDSCLASVKSYITNVQSACDKSGDGANMYMGGPYSNLSAVPVDIVGKIFEYTYAKGCAKNATSYCYLELEESSPASDVSCADTCDVAFYGNAHNYEGSAYEFNYYYLVQQSSWWEDEFEVGWNNIKDCSSVTDLAPSSTAEGSQPTETSSADDTTTTESVLPTSTLAASTTATATATSTQGTSAPSQTANASNRQQLSWGAMGLAGMALWVRLCV